MYEFQIRFQNRTAWGDHYIVWWWSGADWHTISDKLYYGSSKREIIDMIKNEIKTRFGVKRAKWKVV